MDLIRWSISKPVSVTVGVILVVMFGLIGLGAIPLQLTPTIDKPIVTVTTNWPGRSPQEIVDSITREQEKRLKNVANLKRMRSNSSEGQAVITLEFYVGSEISRALQEVSDALRQVPDYPDEVDEPVIKAADGASENAIAWIIVDVDPQYADQHPDFDITTLYDALDKEVKPFLERIDGVAEINIYGGREREVRVLLDPRRLAQRSLNHLDIISALQGENRNVSAGTIAEGKRDYRVRVVGQFVTEQDVLNTIVAYRPDPGSTSGALKPVYVHDVADVEFGYQKMRGFVRSFGYPSIAMNAIRQSNANVVSVMRDLRARLEDIRKDLLPKLAGDVGPHLRMRQVYDETTYIDSAISLVTENLWQGGLLAALALLIFLRSWIATGIISLAIPISVIGTFLVMVAFGRTLNVVSLAGLAFAVGMVVDNAIVVLENTYRRLALGDNIKAASYWGAKEVWVAILASTLTTVAVFIPVLTIREEAGQLFKDISLAIATSVTLSLVVAITVIPCACNLVLRFHKPHHHRSAFARRVDNLFGVATVADWLVARLGDLLYWLMTGWRAWTLRPAVIIGMAVLSIVGSYKLVPPLDYLPTGNRNLVFGGLLIPPGYSVDHQRDIAERIEGQIKPYMEAASKPESIAQLPPIFRFDAPTRPFNPVAVDNFFIGSFGGGMFVGATSADPDRVIPVGYLLSNSMNSIPDAFGGARQTSIFAGGIEGGNSVNVEVAGPDLSRVVSAAQAVFMSAAQKYSFRNVQPDPANFSLTQPEWTVRVNATGRELGLTSRDVGTAVRGLFDGAFVDDFLLDGDAVSLVLVPPGGRLDYKEQLASTPIATRSLGPDGRPRVVPLDSVVDVYETRAPQAIQRSEELPSVTVKVSPPPGVTVDEIMNYVRTEVVAPLEKSANGKPALIDSSMRVRMEGTAADLDSVRASLFGSPRPNEGLAGWQRGVVTLSLAIAGVGVLASLWSLLKASGLVKTRSSMPRARFVYGALGFALLSLIIGGLLSGIAYQPQYLTARFIWALLVTYLLMCSVFESFLYPFVIMFSVPLAVVGGFAGLALVHWATLQDPTKAPQQFDVVTMLGFVVLIGTVVNNAILIIEQSLNFEDPERYGAKGDRMPLFVAVRTSVVSRMRPIFMTTFTTIGGLLPLALAPGAGSEMYRGMGAVILGGMLCSTLFTLVLVPLVFSIVVEMQEGVRGVLGARHPRALLKGDPFPPRAAALPGSESVGDGSVHEAVI